MEKESKWREKFKTLKQYHDHKYPAPYFGLSKFEYEIDPDETVEDFNKYDINKQRIEFAKCALDFFYFAHKYVKILHPRHGLVPFVCYKYQHHVIDCYGKFRHNIIAKFRQGGLTTLTELWGMWRCMFMEEQQIVLISKTDREAKAAGGIVDRAVQNLPLWMAPSPQGKWNEHKKEFFETGGCMSFHTPEAARGLAINFLILDEAAFIDDMDKHWKGIYPILSTGGNAIVISTVNGLGNWYEKYYHRSKRTGKPFHVIDLDFTDHPDYNNPAWVADQKSQLGEKGFQQEVLRSFHGSGETYIPSNIVSDLVLSTQNNPPIRKLFKKWVNKVESQEDDVLGGGFEGEEFDTSWEREGAMWVWKEPKEGEEFIMGVDTAEGIGSDGDNSCIEVFNTQTLEQVAEFYSNSIQPYQFAQVVNEIAIYYNHALVVVENLGSGGAVISNLQHNLYYDNLYFEPTSNRMPKAGLKVTLGNRLTILEALQQHTINKTMRINSRRLVQEIATFTHNVNTSKIEAQKGCHDDAIMAGCIAMFVRDTLLRSVPLGSVQAKDEVEATKTLSYEEIKKEIMEGSPRNLLDEFTTNKKIVDVFSDEEITSMGVAFDFRRKLDTLLKEFGWIIFWAILLVSKQILG